MKVFTANFTTQLRNTTIYGEATVKPSDPLGYNASDMIAAFGNGTAAFASGKAVSLLQSAAVALGAAGQTFLGYDRLTQDQFNLGIKQVVPKLPGGGELVLSAEAAVKTVGNLPNVNVLRIGRSDMFGIGPVNGVCLSAGQTAAFVALQCSNNGYVTSTSWGYRLNAALHFGSEKGMSFSPSIGLSQDVHGWSADGLFMQGRQVLNLAAQLDFKKRLFVGTTWNPELKTSPYDINSDRQYYSLYAGFRF